VDQATTIHLAVRALTVTMTLSAPFLVAGLVVGLAVSVFQAATSIQEQTLSFVPKILVMGAVVVIAGPWMLTEMLGYTRQLFESIPTLVRP